MSDYEHSVFVSYAWGGEREEIVNQIDQAMQARGIRIIRDKRELGYKGSIGEFMERIGRGNCVIVVISDKYLRSKNCMFELVEIAENKQFSDRIFPIILTDARIYDAVERLEYVEYWEKEKARLNERIRGLSDFANLQGIREDLDNYDRFRDRISGLTNTLKDMNTLTPDIHRESEFNELYVAIENRIKESRESPETEPVIETINTQYFEPETVLIPAGPFLMGSPPGEGVPVYEMPQHEVILSSYHIGIQAVTNLQYEEFVRQTGRPAPRGWNGRRVPEGLENIPVSGVAWYDTLEYCSWLSDLTGRNYSLPSEAQLEKAHRGSYALADPVDNVYQWTCTLWGERIDQPDRRYFYPWREDGRNNLSANRQIRRIVCVYSQSDNSTPPQRRKRFGELPGEVGLPGARYSFRIIRSA